MEAQWLAQSKKAGFNPWLGCEVFLCGVSVFSLVYAYYRFPLGAPVSSDSPKG